MAHVLTLMTDFPAYALDPSRVERVARAIGAGPAQWLSEREAADLPCAETPDMARVTAALGGAPVDAIAQPATGRRKRLLVSDMDSTIVTSETLDELAAYAGLKDEVAAITRRSMNGEIDFSQALRERVGMLAGLDTAALEATWATTAFMPGAAELVATMRAHGARTVLVSGGFTWFTGRVAAALGFDAHFANTLEFDAAHRLTGAVGNPILDREAKLSILRSEAMSLSIGADAAIAVGDGANDLAMIRVAGLGVAFRAKPVVAAETCHRVRHCGLRALLFAQGYTTRDFSGAALRR